MIDRTAMGGAESNVDADMQGGVRSDNSWVDSLRSRTVESEETSIPCSRTHFRDYPAQGKTCIFGSSTASLADQLPRSSGLSSSASPPGAM
ncbi:uncharacterized protein N7459_003261 [Penicillium hispanicum]|uniref:uncharacterized protein n=1 Tax=Penicillium hispanicum TaxID=1080232 RepID=UPI002540E912|nr:uncharacterized protein N7459_003261 [Penicillium hispanicum]KAJ5587496.1 hypothetical protein N7459_003261 [Penicillium hispanicum]